MARIQIYPLDTDLDGADKLVGTDGTVGADLNKTKNFTLSDLKHFVRPCKVYTALLSQPGDTSAPTAIELDNTIGTITFTYEDIGAYSATSAGLFTADKTVTFCTVSTDPGNPTYMTARISDADTIRISVFDINGGVDGIANASFEIRVYN